MKCFVTLLFFILLVSSCGGSKDLGDGYKYVKIYSDTYAISDSKSKMIIEPNVMKYDSDNEYIVGYRELANYDYPQGFLPQKSGYFVYKKSNGSLRLGLNEIEFFELLKSENISVRLK